MLTAEGQLRFRGAPVEPAAHVAALGQGAAVRVVPSRASPAARLVEVANALRAAGAERVVVVAERGAP